MLSCHAPPANLDDFRQLPNGHAQWHAFINRLLDDAVDSIAALPSAAPAGGTVAPRFFNPSRLQPPGKVVALPILWNAFPRNLLARHGRDKALALADMLWPFNAPDHFDPLSPVWASLRRETSSWMRPQDEYCEWRVERDPATQRIRRVVFTAEAPEYWEALHRGDPALVARLYRRMSDRSVHEADLLNAHGYDVANRWNTSHGIVHLCHPKNTLKAQVQLCADSSVPVQRASNRGFITDPHALCAARDSGRLNTHSDPTIAGTINALARAGAWLSLADPVGLCIDDVDTAGWRLPDDTPPRDCLHILRGAPGCTLRLAVQAPPASRFGIDALTIGDEPLLHGGQIAECITMKAVALAVMPATAPPLSAPPLSAVAPTWRAYLLQSNRRLLLGLKASDPLPPGALPAFVHDLWP